MLPVSFGYHNIQAEKYRTAPDKPNSNK